MEAVYLVIALSLIAFTSAATQEECLANNQCFLEKTGDCLDIGVNQTVGCTTFTCKRTEIDGGFHYLTDIAELKCQYNGRCVPDGIIRKNRVTCVTYECQVTKLSDTQYQAGMIIIKRECPNPKRGQPRQYKCIGVGKWRRFSDNCLHHECVNAPNDAGDMIPRIVVSQYGCVNPLRDERPSDYKCIGEGKYRRNFEKCMRHTCVREQVDGKDVLKIASNVYGCRHEGSCVLRNRNARFEDQCATRKCKVTKTSETNYDISFVPVSIDCRDNINNECHPDGSTLLYNIRGSVYNCTCNVNLEADPPTTGFTQCKSSP